MGDGFAGRSHSLASRLTSRAVALIVDRTEAVGLRRFESDPGRARGTALLSAVGSPLLRNCASQWLRDWSDTRSIDPLSAATPRRSVGR